MTINIGLVTSDAVVLGCDSVASTTEHYIDPFPMDWRKVAGGLENQYSITFSYDDLKPIVTNAWGGVTKLFEVHPAPTPVVAVTAGLAKLNGRPIASIARDFYALHQKRTQHLVKVEVIAKEFLKFVRKEYERHYDKSPLPDALKEGPEFLIGGYGRDDNFATIFRVDVQQNLLKKEFGVGASLGRTGISWNGQSDAVERFVRGYNFEARSSIEIRTQGYFRRMTTDHATYFTTKINEILDKLGKNCQMALILLSPMPIR